MTTDQRRRVGVIMGGRSSEREVSLSSGRQVYYNLDRVKYVGVPIFMDPAGRLWRMSEKLVLQNTCRDIEARLAADAERLGLEDLSAEVDVVFNALHGKYGDDGCIQGALELVGVPYTGSGVLACALSLDKPMAHALLAAAGFDLPREIVVGAADWAADPDACIARAVDAVGLPAVVLPAREGSSVGVAVVHDPEDYFDAVEAALAYDNRVLVEEYLDGMEFSVILVGNTVGNAAGSGAGDTAGSAGRVDRVGLDSWTDPVTAFLPTETTSDNPFMTYDDKYMPGRSQKITPARVDAPTLARIRAEAVRVYHTLGFQGYARLDGFLMPDGRLLFTDPNSTSGMAPSSFMFHQAAEAGLAPAALVDRILTLAQGAHAAKRGPL